MTAESPRPCYPEWCEIGGEPHDEVCDNAPMPPMTKHEFVEHLDRAARHGIDAYRFLAEHEAGWSFEQMTDMAVDEVTESATCYAGIGSCGRGWCQHS